MKSDRPSLAIVVVSWNVADLIVDCLHSLFDDLQRTPAVSTVWVVDNASSDGTMDAIRSTFPLADYPSLNLIAADENIGFAAANNLALQYMGFPQGAGRPDYVLLLNPDTVVRPGALSALLQGMRQTGAGLGGARLFYGDGSFQHSAFALPGLMQLAIDLFPFPARIVESRLNGRYPREWYERGEPFEVGHPLGATFMLRGEVIEETGMFDEDFYLYAEEVDWAWRIHEAGWRVVCIPSAEVVHLEGQSTRQVRPQSVVNLWKARLQLYRKHYPPLKRLLAVWLVRIGMNWQIKRVARDSALGDEARRELVDAYRQVLRLRRDI